MDINREISNERLAQGLKAIINKLEDIKNIAVNSANEKSNTTKSISKNIYEINNKTTFIKIKSNSFGIEKVIFSFVQYSNENGQNKLLNNIDIYMSFADCLLLCNDVLSGKINKLCLAEKEKGEKYPKPVYKSPLGGINEQKAKERKLRDDGKAISRSFNIIPGRRAPFVFIAEQKAGRTDEATGIIIPESGKAEISVTVSADNDNIKKMALMIKSHITAFMSSQYALGKYDYKKSTK